MAFRGWGTGVESSPSAGITFWRSLGGLLLLCASPGSSLLPCRVLPCSWGSALSQQNPFPPPSSTRDAVGLGEGRELYGSPPALPSQLPEIAVWKGAKAGASLAGEPTRLRESHPEAPGALRAGHLLLPPG